jgi:hypothetical protein
MTRRLLAAVSIACISLSSLVAEDQPQIAYRILSGYLAKEEAEGERGKHGAGIAFATIGGTLIAGGAVTYFAGDMIGESFFGGPMDREIRTNVSLGLGIGGLASTAIGAGILAAKPRDFDMEYAEVFAETDAQVREALAVAALKDLSIKGKKNRMVSAITNLAVPLVYGAARAGMNAVEGKPWNEDIFGGFYWSAWNLASGFGSLFGTSEEERLYEKYLAGRDALYGDRASR